MNKPFILPELDDTGLNVRVPPLESIPITKRISDVIGNAEFQRLRKIRQLSLTHLVYPGAMHTRFEHSLGVYQNMRLYLKHLIKNEQFEQQVTQAKLLSILLAALLHDIGHYPNGHVIEGEAPGLFDHEARGREIVGNLNFSGLLKPFEVDPMYVGRLICGDSHGLPESEVSSFRLLRDLLDCAIDADKMDYLERDSLHCGVPYGRSYDKDRLIGSLTVSPENRLAITDKGKASAEYVMFSRYVMLTEVYWHHAVRAGSVMLIRAFQEGSNLHKWSQFLENLMDRFGDDETMNEFAEISQDDPDIAELIRGIRTRNLYKRIRTYSPLDPDSAQVFQLLKNLDKPGDGRKLSILLESALELPRMRILVDIVPAKLMGGELTVYFPKRGQYRKLSQISPIAKSLTQTWPSITGIVRVYVHPAYRDRLELMGNQIDEAIAVSCRRIIEERQ